MQGWQSYSFRNAVDRVIEEHAAAAAFPREKQWQSDDDDGQALGLS